MDRRTFLQAALALPMAARGGRQRPRLTASSAAAGVAWTQWGGPHRNFTTEASGIKDTWPASGPRVVWKRTLGEGYSSPAVDSGVLYSMYGKRGEEVVFVANAETGQTLWEHATPMTFVSDAATQHLWTGHRGSVPFTGNSASSRRRNSFDRAAPLAQSQRRTREQYSRYGSPNLFAR